MSIWKKCEVLNNGNFLGFMNFNSNNVKKFFSSAIVGFMLLSSSGCSINDVNHEQTVVEIGIDENNIEALNAVIDKKDYFVQQVLNELQVIYETDGNTVALNLYNKLILKYRIVADLQYSIDKNNEAEYRETTLYSSIESKKKEMLHTLDSIINDIKNETKWRYGFDFVKESLESVMTETIKEKIENKKYFVDSVLNEMNDSREKDMIYKYYEKALGIEYNLDPNNEQEYHEILLHSSIEEKQQEMLAILNDIIVFIENNTKWKYGQDFVKGVIKK